MQPNQTGSERVRALRRSNYVFLAALLVFVAFVFSFSFFHLQRETNSEPPADASMAVPASNN